MKIFLSVGRTSTDEQENYVRRIEESLRMQGFTPQTVGRNYFSSLQPLKAVSSLMDECVGTIIVAFERTYISQAIDRRGSSKEAAIANVKLPTVWNQIEATMAYMHGHPLLVMVEEGLKPEGLFEKDYDWYVLETDIRQLPFTDMESSGVLNDWMNRVKEYSRSKEQGLAGPPTSPTVGDQQLSRLSDLRKKIALYMDLEEIANLSFDLGIEFDNLKGSEKESKARELVGLCNRTGRLDALIRMCQEARPNVSWT